MYYLFKWIRRGDYLIIEAEEEANKGKVIYSTPKAMWKIDEAYGMRVTLDEQIIYKHKDKDKVMEQLMMELL